MGLMDWFRVKRRLEVLEDRIWLSEQAKFQGIADAADQACAADCPAAVIFVAHFNDCLEALRKVLNDRQYTCPVVATTAETLQQVLPPRISSLTESDWVLLLVAERHPLPVHDKTIIEFAGALPCRAKVTFHLALEDPLLRCFSGDGTKNLLRRLGMQAGESISSSLVTRQIKGAQQEIAAHAVGDRSADSAAEWIERYCPAFAPRD